MQPNRQLPAYLPPAEIRFIAVHTPKSLMASVTSIAINNFGLHIVYALLAKKSLNL